MAPSTPQVLLVIVVLIATVVPPILVLSSRRSRGGAKFGWFVATLFFSWIAYAAFLVATRKPTAPNE